MNSTSRLLIAAATILSVGSCGMQRIDIEPSKAPYKSFIYVKGDAPVIDITTCDRQTSDDCVTTQNKRGMHIRGSGIVVANSVTHPGRQYVMTAGHICEAVDSQRREIRRRHESDPLKLNRSIKSIDITMTLRLADNHGNVSIGKVIGLNSDRDLCIIAIQGAKLPVVKFARDYPTPGDRIFNIAAPLGEWEPGSTHRFDGYYSGPWTCTDDYELIYSCKSGEKVWSRFSLAATHGSSGSPIFNWRGELIGIVVMVTVDFQHLVFAVRLEDMKALLERVMEFEKSPEGLRWNPNFDEIDSVTGATVKVH